MTPHALVEQLLALPDVAAQEQFLGAHTGQLDDAFAAALKEQADGYLRTDSRRSLQVASLLLHTASLTGDPCQRALGLLAEANARSIGLGEYQRAIELYDAAAELYRDQGRVVDEAKAQIGKVWPLATMSLYQEALETGRWAGSVLEEHAEWLALAKLMGNLAVIRGRQGEDSEALALFDRARDLYAQLGEVGRAFLPRVEHNRAIVLRNLGRFEESIRASNMARSQLASQGQNIGVARAQQSLAVTYFVLGRYNEALELLDEARAIFWSDGRQRDAILADLFISDCLLQLRRFADVLEKCRRVRELFAGLGTRFEVAQALLNEATAHAGLGYYGEALAVLAEARRLFEAEENSVWVASVDLETAALLQGEGHHEASLALAQASAAVFKAHALLVAEARAYLQASRAAAALGRKESANQLLAQVLAVGEGSNIPWLSYQARHLVGTLKSADDPQGALAEYERAIRELERLRAWLMVEFRADFLEDKGAVYEDAVSLCLGLGQPLRGLEYAERAKSRALLDLLANRLDLSIQARRSEDAQLVAELARLRSDRDRLYRRSQGNDELRERSWSSPGGDQQEAQQEVLALEKRITELWHTLLIRNADYARDASLWQVRVEPVQPYLPPGTALLEYFIVHGHLVAFVVTPESVQARTLPLELATARRLVQLLWVNLRAVPRVSAVGQVAALAANARGILTQLYTRLVEPLADLVAPQARLIVVPHGPLHYLPFHALHNEQVYLIEQHEMSYLPGASFLRYCHEAPLTCSAAGLVAFGHSSDGRLPYAVQEARSVAGLFDGQAYTEEEATIAELRRVVPGCRVLHMATHGDFRPDNPLFSGLVLRDGWLTTLDIFNLRVRASLVTLSACQTGRSVVGGGDELLGLMRAFLYAGASSLVLSLWAVEDRSTAQLMEAFYLKLAEGWTKGAALRHAQLQFARGERDGADIFYVHPYYWAPFFLVGDNGVL